MICHLMSYAVSLFFSSQMYFERTVSCEWFWFLKESLWLLNLVLKSFSVGSFENKALENEDRSTKHPNLENEAPKTRNHCTLKDYNF